MVCWENLPRVVRPGSWGRDFKKAKTVPFGHENGNPSQMVLLAMRCGHGPPTGAGCGPGEYLRHPGKIFLAGMHWTSDVRFSPAVVLQRQECRLQRPKFTADVAGARFGGGSVLGRKIFPVSSFVFWINPANAYDVSFHAPICRGHAACHPLLRGSRSYESVSDHTHALSGFRAISSGVVRNPGCTHQ